MTLELLGGKKGKKKNYTTKKKNKHKHKNVKLAVLKFYNIDASNHVTNARKVCPTCGVGIFMAKHFDRLYCGKCGTTFKLEASQIEKKKEKVKVVEAPKEDAPTKKKAAPAKDAKKGVAKDGKADAKAGKADAKAGKK